MHSLDEYTITAVATPPGEGGVAIIRISGPEAETILRKVFIPTCGWPAEGMKSHHLVYGRFMLDGDTVDEGLAVMMRAPHSYTGEDTAELHCHGGMATTRAVLRAALHAGAVMAQPGEFTRRAFMHGRIDLSQAEAVMDLVAARTQSAARVALHQLQGQLGRRIQAAREDLLNALALLEATVDYPEDDLEEAAALDASQAAQSILDSLTDMLRTADAGRLDREGLRCALLGRPNVGKSSLLNALLGEDRAMVTEIPGTTRDTLEEELLLDGLRLILVDTAGIRATGDRLEQMGVDRARRAMDTAQLILLVIDAADGLDAEDTALYRQISHLPHIILCNKADLGLHDEQVIRAAFPESCVVFVSALTGEGLDTLAAALREKMAVGGVLPGEAMMSNVRHIDATERAKASLTLALGALRAGYPPDIAAVDLRAAWHALGEVTGGTVDEEVVDRIFARFCLGK